VHVVRRPVDLHAAGPSARLSHRRCERHRAAVRFERPHARDPEWTLFGSIALMGGGGLVAVTGLSLMLYGATLNATNHGPYGSAPRMLGDGFVTGGAVVTGIGVAALVAGAVLFGTSRGGVDSSSPLPAGGGATRATVTIGPLSDGGFTSNLSGRF
jgi:hypothetical protein